MKFGRSEDQSGFIAGNRRPAGASRTRGRGKYRFEPLARRGMKKLERTGRLLRKHGFAVLRHVDQSESFLVLNNEMPALQIRI